MADKLFSQGGDVTPTLTDRVASGKEGKNAVNSSWQTIVTWLESVLGFLKIANNLSDLNNVGAAQTNLDVYSKGESNTLLDAKAAKTNVLEKDNTTTYEPTSAYNPATKKYTDEGGAVIPWATITASSANVIGISQMRSCKIGPYVHLTGLLEINGGSENDVLYSLPTTYPVFSETIYFIAGDGNDDVIIELKAVTGTRSIALGAGLSTNDTCHYSVAIPII